MYAEAATRPVFGPAMGRNEGHAKSSAGEECRIECQACEDLTKSQGLAQARKVLKVCGMRRVHKQGRQGEQWRAPQITHPLEEEFLVHP